MSLACSCVSVFATLRTTPKPIKLSLRLFAPAQVTTCSGLCLCIWAFSVLAVAICCLRCIMRESNKCAHAGLHMADYKTWMSCACCCQGYCYFVWACAMPMLQFGSHTARKVCDCFHDLTPRAAGLSTALHVLKCSALHASP